MPWQTEGSPVVEARIVGPGVVCIDYFEVPEEWQGQGLGREFYQEWESNLPPEIVKIILCAAGDDQGAEIFWVKMGFQLQRAGVASEGDVVMVKYLKR